MPPHSSEEPAASSVARTSRDGRARASSWSSLRACVRALDPSDDPGAEPVGLVFVVTFVVALVVAARSYLRFPIQPMQDLGHHLGLAAIVSDWGQAGSIYTDLYERFDPLCANSLLYAIAGTLGRTVGVVPAMQFCILGYLVGLPIATLFALRVYGRSPWPAVLAVALTHNMNFVAGFANFVFAAPFLVVSIASYQKFLDRPSATRGAIAACAFACTFLAHAHVYLFLGVVTIGMSLAAMFDPSRAARFARKAERHPGRRLVEALLVALPSLLLFARWVYFVFVAPETRGGGGLGQGRDAPMLGASFLSADELLRLLFDHSMRTMFGPEEGRIIAAMILLTLVSVALSRRSAHARPPVLEITFVAAFALYFLLPENVAGQQVIATRQVGVALWFLPALVVPPHPRASRLAHAFVVAAIVAYTGGSMVLWNERLERFHRDEASGLVEVLEAAPPRLRLYYAKSDPNSAYFRWRSFWHVEKYYMALRLGQTWDTPAIYAHNAVRYRRDRMPVRIEIHDERVATSDAIWSTYDLLLLRRWRPTPEVRAALESRARLVARSGDWEVWQSRRTASVGRTERR